MLLLAESDNGLASVVVGVQRVSNAVLEHPEFEI
jgi:hypothetical protein